MVNLDSFLPEYWTLTEKYGLWTVTDSRGFLAGPFGNIEDAREWIETHKPEEFETKTFYKK